jgi:chromate reductase, NAD(P)H dehydrogenase (quinone)
MNRPRILAFSGSARRASFNQRLVEHAARNAVDLGAEVTVINLRDFPMPLMNQDLERDEGVPPEALRLKALLAGHDGILLSAPEYNSSITPLLKNSLDWVSRRVADEPPMLAFRGKTAALLSASPGRLGGLRGLVHVRAILNNLGVLVLPGQVSIPSAGAAFDDTGGLANDADRKRVADLVSEHIDTLRRLAAGGS